MAAASTTANYDSAQIINKSKKVVKEDEQPAVSSSTTTAMAKGSRAPVREQAGGSIAGDVPVLCSPSFRGTNSKNKNKEQATRTLDNLES